MLKVLIACEGPTDFIIIKNIVKKVAAERKVIVRVERLFPKADKNRGSPAGGWPNLKIWCQERASELARGKDLLGAALSFDQKGLIIVQMDTDVASDINLQERFGIAINGKQDRKRIVRNALDGWIGGHAKKKEDGVLYYCLTTHALETWILATYDPKDIPGMGAGVVDYEEISDWEDKLLAMGYSRDGDRLKKKESLYKTEKYCGRVLSFFDRACDRSEELSNLRSVLQSLVE